VSTRWPVDAPASRCSQQSPAACLIDGKHFS
jgi:hypothetical protein